MYLKARHVLNRHFACQGTKVISAISFIFTILNIKLIMRYIKILLLLSFIIVESQSLWAQGCVAIRGSSCSAGLGVSNTLLKGEFIAGTGFRYFKSYKHFRGLEEETNRVAEGTEVVNKSYSVVFV